MKNAFEYEAALAALREELAKYKGGCVDLSSQVRELEHKMDYWKGEGKRADEARQRLADAERRNADMVRLLTRARIYAHGEFRDEIDAYLDGKTAPVSVVLPRDPEKAFLEWASNLMQPPSPMSAYIAAIYKVKELNQ